MKLIEVYINRRLIYAWNAFMTSKILHAVFADYLQKKKQKKNPKI